MIETLAVIKAITNGGVWSIFEALSPAHAFVLVDRKVPRKSLLVIASTVQAHWLRRARPTSWPSVQLKLIKIPPCFALPVF